MSGKVKLDCTHAFISSASAPQLIALLGGIYINSCHTCPRPNANNAFDTYISAVFLPESTRYLSAVSYSRGSYDASVYFGRYTLNAPTTLVQGDVHEFYLSQLESHVPSRRTLNSASFPGFCCRFFSHTLHSQSLHPYCSRLYVFIALSSSYAIPESYTSANQLPHTSRDTYNASTRLPYTL